MCEPVGQQDYRPGYVAAKRRDTFFERSVPGATHIATRIAGEIQPSHRTNPTACVGIDPFQTEMAGNRGMTRQLGFRTRGGRQIIMDKGNHGVARPQTCQKLSGERQRRAQIRMMRRTKQPFRPEMSRDNTGEVLAARRVTHALAVEHQLGQRIEVAYPANFKRKTGGNGHLGSDTTEDLGIAKSVADFHVEWPGSHEPGCFVARMRAAGIGKQEHVGQQWHTHMPGRSRIAGPSRLGGMSRCCSTKLSACSRVAIRNGVTASCDGI